MSLTIIAMKIIDLGNLSYRDAWAAQESAHDEVLAGGEERILIVEHPPVITLGRRAGVEANIVASAEELSRRGVEVVQSDRGGDVTFHGPGQIVAYPIVRLIDHKLSVGSYVRVLEAGAVAALRDVGVRAGKDACAIGVWVKPAGWARAGKICAVGVRVRRGVTLHGVALNVETDLSYFDLIIPCGLTGRSVASVRQVLGDATPAMSVIKQRLAARLIQAISGSAEVSREIGIVGEGAVKCDTVESSGA